MNTRWTINDTEHLYRVARPGAFRWDVVARAGFPRCRPSRLAMQIRQDMWRRLQKLRGFSPMVEITQQGGALLVQAGGQIEGRFPKAYIEVQIADLLHDHDLRSRWLLYARFKPGQRRGSALGKSQ